ncbi:MAG: hypothetical protein KJ901_15010 [Gammaproteobacteria bacterium]|nr:hypothetical protein [Gammaproteobacteria bacterium]MBU1441998.1 hypothetical protein [Gammaproteobacteria bacterium]
MDIGFVGIVAFALSGLASFLIGRWLSRGRRKKKAERERLEREASESRQVRRARQRKG